jgi:hypothetical protein
MQTSEVTACVIDNGQFPYMAERFAKEFKKVFYCTDTNRAFCKVLDLSPGCGFESFTRINDFWDIKNECQLFIFPDLGFSGLQNELRGQGYAVWGGGYHSHLEYHRGHFLDALKKCGLEVPTHVVIDGFESLRSHLRDKEDKYIKVNRIRGDWETFHWRNWKADESTLAERAFRLGPHKEEMFFYVFDAIETDVEDGLDTYCIDGQIPKLVMHAMEWKDKAFLGAMQPFEDVDEGLRTAVSSFASTHLTGTCSQFLSGETRLVGDKTYFIDLTWRCGSPPSQMQCNLISNLGEIVWKGANGELVEPEAVVKFGGQILISEPRDADEWSVVQIPGSIQEYTKFSFASKFEDDYVIAPSHLGPMLGWLTATGDTIEEVIDKLKEYRKELPSGVDCDVASMANLLEEAKEAKEMGVKITHQKIPEPEIVLE